MSEKNGFEPLIIGFTCNWCSYRAADLAGMSRVKYPPNVRLMRLMCSGRLDPTFVLKAFAGGADGVMITGCHPGECHYLEQNYKALRSVLLTKRMLDTIRYRAGASEAGLGQRGGRCSLRGRGHQDGRGSPSAGTPELASKSPLEEGFIPDEVAEPVLEVAL